MKAKVPELLAFTYKFEIISGCSRGPFRNEFRNYRRYSQLLENLVDEVIARDYPALLEKFKTVRKRFSQGWGTLREALFSGDLPPDLTEREYEVARLAAEGLRNSEIAEKLVITESTVRTHMRVIFQKLQIDRRTRLAEKLK